MFVPKCRETLRPISEKKCTPKRSESCVASQAPASFVSTNTNIDHSPPYDDFAVLSSDRLYKDDIKKCMLTEVWESASKFKFPLR
jgi:hypothetical protein